MPKVNLCKPVPPPNLLRDLFDRHMKAKGISSTELGARLNMAPESVRRKKSRGVWTNEDIKAWCTALDITDPAEIGKAIMNLV